MVSPAEPVTVLLVEDSVVLAERVRELITAMPGVQLLSTVADEEEALEFLRNNTVEAMILDLQLKRGTGFGVLRGMDGLQTKPVVIVFTNYDLAGYREKAKTLGAAYFLDKSRDYDRLGEILRSIRSSN